MKWRKFFFVKKLDKVFKDFSKFERKMELKITDKEKRKDKEATVCYFYDTIFIHQKTKV